MTTTYDHGIITYSNTSITLPSFSCNLQILPNSLPTGSIFAYVGSGSSPTGWLFCDGTAISRTTYSDLFSIIGIKYGSGDGVTTFNLPNMMSGAGGYGIFPAGSATTANDGFNVDGVRKIQSGTNNQKISVNQMPSHNHTMNHTHEFYHTHNVLGHGHTINDHTHSMPSHNHSITYSNTNYVNDTSFTTSGNTNSGTNSRVNQGYNDTVMTTLNTTGSASVITSGSASVTISDSASVTTSGYASITTTGSASINTTSDTPSSQMDYVPSFTAFLWIIKI